MNKTDMILALNVGRKRYSEQAMTNVLRVALKFWLLWKLITGKTSPRGQER